jgi:hypothetical protein
MLTAEKPTSVTLSDDTMTSLIKDPLGTQKGCFDSILTNDSSHHRSGSPIKLKLAKILES